MKKRINRMDRQKPDGIIKPEKRFIRFMGLLKAIQKSEQHRPFRNAPPDRIM